MAASRFSRLYRKILDERLMLAGFRETQGCHWRERDRIVHVIALERSRASDFTGLFAAMPLVTAADQFTFGFGGRVHELGPEPHGNWPTPSPNDSEQIARIIGGYAQAIERFVLPWLDRFNRPIDLVRADQANTWGLRRPSLGFARVSRKDLELGLCALADEDLDAAESYLGSALRAYTSKTYPPGPGWDHVRATIALCEYYLDCLRRHDLDAIRARIADAESSARRALGLPGAVRDDGAGQRRPTTAAG